MKLHLFLKEFSTRVAWGLSILKRFSTGIILGTSLSFITLLGIVAWGLFFQKAITIPGIFRTMVGSENGLPAIEITPNYTGITLLILVISVAYTLLGKARLQK